MIQQQLFEPVTAIMIETSFENHLEPNVFGSTPVQLVNIFSVGVLLSYKNKRMLSVQEKELWVFSTTTTI